MKPTRKTVPRYQTLADELISKIEAGTYAIGSQFPTEFQICAEHAVSRHTVRAALARLNALGLIQRRPGAGTHVTAPTPPMCFQEEVTILDDLLQYGDATRLQLQSSERVVPPPAIAKLLGVRPGLQVIRLFGLRFGEPLREAICTTEFFLRPTRTLPAAALLTPDTGVAAVFKVLDLRQMGHVDQTFDAVSAAAEHARLLGIKSGSAALRVQRVYYGLAGQCVGCAISLHPAGRFAYRMRLARRTAP